MRSSSFVNDIALDLVNDNLRIISEDISEKLIFNNLATFCPLKQYGHILKNLHLFKSGTNFCNHPTFSELNFLRVFLNTAGNNV